MRRTANRLSESHLPRFCLVDAHVEPECVAHLSLAWSTRAAAAAARAPKVKWRARVDARVEAAKEAEERERAEERVRVELEEVAPACWRRIVVSESNHDRLLHGLQLHNTPITVSPLGLVAHSPNSRLWPITSARARKSTSVFRCMLVKSGGRDR